LLALILVPLPVKAANSLVMEVWPTSGNVGTEVTITVVSVFVLNDEYEIWWSKSPNFEEGSYIVIAKGRGAKGSQQITDKFTVPESPCGINYVKFMRFGKSDINSGQCTFNVVSDIAVSPASASVRSRVTIIGTGFGVDEPCQLSFDGKVTDVKIKSDNKGSFVAEFAIPDTMNGVHKIEVVSEKLSTRIGKADLNIVPGLKLSPELPEIGGKVNLAGSGFAANSKVSIKYDDVTVASSPDTDAAGKFSYDFNVPETPKTQHKITATDKAGNTATLSLPLEGMPPPAPATISPKDERFGLFSSCPVNFTWTDVSDPSGVSYTLEIAENLKFFPVAPGMRRTGLTQTTCTVELKPGTYYWRVMAIDGAGNKSPWTLSSNAFKVGFISMWVLIGSGFVFLIVSILLIRAFFRRLRAYYY